jgi:urea transport system ATP-binding protein
MLETQNVSSFYGNSPVLQSVSVSAGVGDFLAVLGRNGVGKTTLLKTVMGLTDRVTGRILLDGQDITHSPTHERSFHGIGYVPQGRGIIPRFTVRENILMGTFARPDGKRELPELAFELFPILREFLNRMGGVLSGGQQQQLAIARALAANPRIVLLDEPTEGIQPNIVEQIEQAIVRLNHDHGMTIILVDQNVNFARRAAQRFVIMEKGQIAANGAVGDLTDELVHRHMAV